MSPLDMPPPPPPYRSSRGLGWADVTLSLLSGFYVVVTTVAVMIRSPQRRPERKEIRSARINLCGMWKKRIECPIVGDVSIRSRNGAPARKGRVVNAQNN